MALAFFRVAGGGGGGAPPAADAPPPRITVDGTSLTVEASVGRNAPVFDDDAFARALGGRDDWTAVTTRRTRQLTDAAIDALARCAALRSVELDTDRITDAGLERLAALPTLERCVLGARGDGLAATNAGAAAFARAPALKELVLRIKDLDDSALEALAAAPRLESLALLNPNNVMWVTYSDEMGNSQPQIPNGVSRVTGRGIAALAMSRTLRRLHLEAARIEPEDMDAVAAIPNLESLTWIYEWGTFAPPKRFDDDFFRALARAPKLKELHLYTFLMDVTETGLAALADCGQLERLSLGILRLPAAQHDPMLARLGGLTKLEHLKLDVYSPAFTDAGFRRLAPLTRMKSFQLTTGKGLTDAALPAMDGWDELETLRLDASNLSDEMLRWAARRPALRRLANIYTSRLTDAGLDALDDGGTRLVELDVRGGFTRRRFNAFKAAHPDMRITPPRRFAPDPAETPPPAPRPAPEPTPEPEPETF